MILAVLVLLAGSTGEADAAAPRPIEIEVASGSQQNCVFRIEGRTIAESALKKMLEADPDKQRQIHISSASDAPWRCVAGAVYTAQKSGFKTVGFVTVPASK